MDSLIHKQEAYAVVGACFEVYNEKGNGFLEEVYQEALGIEFEIQGLPHQAKVPLQLSYKGLPLKKRYEPDYITHDKIIVELKAVKELNDDHRSQVFNYLKATGFQLGILVNFGKAGDLQYERIVKTR